jgi:hypothetical protein
MLYGALLMLSCAGSDGVDDRTIDDTGIDDWSGGPYAVTGTLTWDVHFADLTKDCSYTRTYRATEDWSEPWTCPDCIVRWRADVTTEGTDCYVAASGGKAPSGTEYVGVALDGTFRRQ